MNAIEQPKFASSCNLLSLGNEQLTVPKNAKLSKSLAPVGGTLGTPTEFSSAKFLQYGRDNSTTLEKTHSVNMPASLIQDQMTLSNVGRKLDSNSITSWEKLFLDMRQAEQDAGVWNSYLFLQQTGNTLLLKEPSADYLRYLILESALQDPARMSHLLRTVKELQRLYGYTWNHLYAQCMHMLLGSGNYESARQMHFRLYPSSPPTDEELGNLLSTFVIDPSSEVQKVLNTIYIFSHGRTSYDYIIPVLFQSGQSSLAKIWRKKLLNYNDVPSQDSRKSRLFLGFLSSYFPGIPLSQTEREVVKDFLAPREPVCHERSTDMKAILKSTQFPKKGLLSDATVARWFASSWASLEFTINLLGKVGLGELGPLALQSLALREDNLPGIRDRLAQLDRIEVPISQTTYCRLIVLFTKRGDEESLNNLLHCDVHPDEFDDTETREMLLAEALRKHDHKMERLFRAIEYTLQSSVPQKLSNMLPMEPQSTEIVSNPLQVSKPTKLQSAFRRISVHPSTGFRSPRWEIDEAITTIRLSASQDRAVALGYWRVLIKVLGRSARFSELEQICSEIVDMYHPRYGGIIPIHPKDCPVITNEKGSAKPTGVPARSKEQYASEDDDYESKKVFPETHLTEDGYSGIRAGLQHPLADDVNETLYIPSDFAFHHQQHPIRKLFTPKLQRSIVRWGFDYGVKYKPPAVGLAAESNIMAYDLAKGVRLLAILRDKGVFIDEQTLKSGLRARLALSRIARRAQDRTRDSNEMKIASMKKMIDEAWGVEILPPLASLLEELESETARQRNNDSRLAGTTLIPKKKGDD